VFEVLSCAVDEKTELLAETGTVIKPLNTFDDLETDALDALDAGYDKAALRNATYWL